MHRSKYLIGLALRRMNQQPRPAVFVVLMKIESIAQEYYFYHANLRNLKRLHLNITCSIPWNISGRAKAESECSID